MSRYGEALLMRKQVFQDIRTGRRVVDKVNKVKGSLGGSHCRGCRREVEDGGQLARSRQSWTKGRGQDGHPREHEDDGRRLARSGHGCRLRDTPRGFDDCNRIAQSKAQKFVRTSHLATTRDIMWGSGWTSVAAGEDGTV